MTMLCSIIQSLADLGYGLEKTPVEPDGIPGINPTLTLWALCVRAVDRLAARLRSGEEL